jgi:hypothetical protein
VILSRWPSHGASTVLVDAPFERVSEASRPDGGGGSRVSVVSSIAWTIAGEL